MLRFFLLLGLCISSVVCRAAPPKNSVQPAQKPADLPVHVRDFKIYSTSAPDAANPAQVVVTVLLRNEGKKPLQTSLQLTLNDKAGFRGAEYSGVLKPGSGQQWTFALQPPQGLHHEILSGDITFGKTRARELYIALEGPDEAGSEKKAINKNVPPITARAQVVGTYAPSVPLSWWQTQPEASLLPQQRKGPLLTLASKGQTKYQIVAQPMPLGADGSHLSLEAWSKQTTVHPSEKELIAAVSDLQRCLNIMSGTTLPVTRARSTPGPSIRLQLNDKRKWPHPDTFRLATNRAGDVLIESGHLDGLRQGIYRLLTRYLDCHWFLPGQMGEEIPTPPDRTVVIGQINEEQKPAFFSSGGMSWGRHREWDARNQSYINRGRMTFGHAWYGLVTPSEQAYKEHPDWWARDREGNIRKFEKGWSHTNFCTTSPEVIEMVAKKINAQLANPDAIVASLDPNDYGPMCLCDRCLALDAKYGVTNQDGTFVTDRLLHFSKEIYDRLEPQNKDKFLGILVYAYQMQLPNKAVPHAHHAGMVCNMDWEYDHTRPFTDPTSPINRDFQRLITGWGKILPQFGFYDYYGHYKFFGPWGQIHKMREDLPAFRDLGGTYLMIEAQPNYAMHGLNLYIAGRLAWDVDADVDVLLEEFYQKFYGPTAPAMRRYWQAIERQYALTRPGPNAIERVTSDPTIWPELEGYLAEATRLAATADKRFSDRIQFHRDGLELGRRQMQFMQLEQPGQKLDPEATLQMVKEGRQWLAERKQKYSDAYYPSFLANYLYPRIEDRLTKFEAMLQAVKEGKPLPAEKKED